MLWYKYLGCSQYTDDSKIIIKHVQRKMVASANKENCEVQKGEQEYCLLLAQGNTIFIEGAYPLVVIPTICVLQTVKLHVSVHESILFLLEGLYRGSHIAVSFIC